LAARSVTLTCSDQAAGSSRPDPSCRSRSGCGGPEDGRLRCDGRGTPLLPCGRGLGWQTQGFRVEGAVAARPKLRFVRTDLIPHPVLIPMHPGRVRDPHRGAQARIGWEGDPPHPVRARPSTPSQPIQNGFSRWPHACSIDGLRLALSANRQASLRAGVRPGKPPGQPADCNIGPRWPRARARQSIKL
jgi:hypothetical protein